MKYAFIIWFMLLASYFVVNKVRYDHRVALGTERIAYEFEVFNAMAWHDMNPKGGDVREP